jgi:hypothetical protein
MQYSIGDKPSFLSHVDSEDEYRQCPVREKEPFYNYSM